MPTSVLSSGGPLLREEIQMAKWKSFGCIVVALAVTVPAGAQTYELAEKNQVGDCYQIELAMTLTGDMKVMRNDQPVSLKLTANGMHRFAERVLAVSAGGDLQKTARAYEIATADITLGNDRSERKLRPERRLIVAQQHNGQSLVYSPSGPLTRLEMELTGEHFNTLALPGLLPGKTVKVGDTWAIPNEVAQFLCCFEGLSTQDLVCKLNEVNGSQAQVTVSGSATGIELGAFVKLTVDAHYQFDLAAHHLTALEWKQKDERGQGPASPASVVETATTVKRNRVTLPETLAESALVSIPEGFAPPSAMTNLVYRYERSPRFLVNYARDWTQVGQTRDHVIFRLMERGDFVAQATITPWDKAKPGEHLTPAVFREAMAKSPSWQQAEVAQEGEIPAEKGYWIYRVAAAGDLDGMRVAQNFFLVAGPTGDQLVVVFTMTPNQADKIGARDIDFVRGIELEPSK
jgi:hypothetical protein